jgi:RHS repeat-associated protein
MKTLNFLLGCYCLFFISSVELWGQAGKKGSDKSSSSQNAHNVQNSKVNNQTDGGGNITSINKSGDLNLNVPLFTIKSLRWNIPISANYQPGIKMEQKSSEIGLGWSMPFGSIVRDYGMYEPDYSVNPKLQKGINSLSPLSPGTTTTASTSTSNHDKLYGYDGLPDTFQLTPDLYHITIPGVGSNTFWSNSATYELKDYKPWKVESTSAIFSFSQEFSRINELNYKLNVSNQLDNGYNFAAAIGIPYYVADRKFYKYVGPIGTSPNQIPANTANSSGSIQPLIGDGIDEIAYRDINTYTITTEDGTKYIYGRALRGQKYLFEDAPYWSTINPSGLTTDVQNSCGEFWKIDYIAEWLLTEIRSYDYYDSNANGIADEGDKGDWVRIEYTQPEKIEKIPGTNSYIKVPMHREWLNYSQTDKYSSLMRERAYITKIITPVKTYEFVSSTKMDVDHDYLNKPVNWVNNQHYIANDLFGCTDCINNLNINYEPELKKYTQIIIKENANNEVIYNVIFNYAVQGSNQELAKSEYLFIRNDNTPIDPNYDPANINTFDVADYKYPQGTQNQKRGKTTLLGIEFRPGGIYTSEEIQDYVFEYTYNPDISEYHKDQMLRMHYSPNLRQSNITAARPLNMKLNHTSFRYMRTQFHYPNLSSSTPLYSESYRITDTAKQIDELGYYYKYDHSNKGRDAWSITNVKIPKGGWMEFEYERDQFDYSNDRTAWKNNGSLQDDQLAPVQHYNTAAGMTADYQSYRARTYWLAPSQNLKHYNQTFSMPMDQYSGGLRLKKKTMYNGKNGSTKINPSEVIYNYGTGHYLSVPSSYWSSYISAFSGFMADERVRMSDEKGQYVSPITYFPNGGVTDFDEFFTKLSANIRLDNGVGDNHYYEYIEEQNPDNSKTKYYYKNPYDLNVIPYRKQQCIYLKGVGVSYEVIIGIVNDEDIRTEIKNVKTEKINSSSTIIETTEQSYTFFAMTYLNVVSNSLSSSQTSSVQYHVYDRDGAPTMLFPNIPPNGTPVIRDIKTIMGSGYYTTTKEFTTSAFQTIRSGFNHTYANFEDVVGLTDGNYELPACTAKIYTSVLTSLSELKTTYKNIETTIKYSYYSNGQVESVKENYGKDNEVTTFYKYCHNTTNGITFNFTTVNLLDPVLTTTSHNTTNNVAPSNNNVLKAIANVYGIANNLIVLESKYTFSGSINSIGEISSYTPYDFSTPSNNTNWIFSDKVVKSNIFSQSSLTKSGNLYTKNTFGYKYEYPKATFILPESKFNILNNVFDATYTGFEDMDDFSQSSANCTSCWRLLGKICVYESVISGGANRCFSIANLNKLIAKRPDVYHSQFKKDVFIRPSYNAGPGAKTTGDYFNYSFLPNRIKIRIKPNSSLPYPLSENKIFETTIDHYNPNNSPLFGTITKNGFTFVDNDYNASLCFENQFAQNGYDNLFGNSGYATVNASGADIEIFVPSRYTVGSRPDHEEFWYNEDPNNIADFSTDQAKTGRKSFYLITKWVSGQTSKTPVRPVEIAPLTASTIKAGFWLKHTGSPGNSLTPNILKLKYQILNQWFTVVSSGSSTVSDNNNSEWVYKEFSISVPSHVNNKWLVVYLENEDLSISSPEKIYIDDITISPDGTRCQYVSYDKFGNPLNITDENENSGKATFDTWGNPDRVFDAYNKLVSDNTYNFSRDISKYPNTLMSSAYISDGLYSTSVAYTDGFGNNIQSVITDRTNNRKMVRLTELDNMYRPIKSYKPMGEHTSDINNTYINKTKYFNDLNTLYGNSYSYSTTVYVDELSGHFKSYKTGLDPGNTNSKYKETYKESNSSTITFQSPLNMISYSANELLILVVKDEFGNPTKIYKDRNGRIVMKESPVKSASNYSYTFDGGGHIQWGAGAGFVYATTYMVYDYAGNLIKVMDPEGNIITYSYNSLSQMIQEVNPNKGTVEYKYDKLGRIKFYKDEEDRNNLPVSLAERFGYFKYDEFGRVIHLGKIKTPSGQSSLFSNTTHLNDLNFPYKAGTATPTAGLEIHKEIIYDGTQANNAVGKMIESKVYSYTPSNKIDRYLFVYDKNGRVIEKDFILDGLPGTHMMFYKYNVAGLVTDKLYVNPASLTLNARYNYKVVNSYDGMGRLSKTQSGNCGGAGIGVTAYTLNLVLGTDGVYNYDALGNLKYKGVAANPTNSPNPYYEYIGYSYDLNNNLLEQIGTNFSFELEYDERSLISLQRWSNTYFDNGGCNLLYYKQNEYKYYYDPMTRLVGANYLERQSSNNPFVNTRANIISTPVSSFTGCKKIYNWWISGGVTGGPMVVNPGYKNQDAQMIVNPKKMFERLNEKEAELQLAFKEEIAIATTITDIQPFGILQNLRNSLDNIYDMDVEALIGTPLDSTYYATIESDMLEMAEMSELAKIDMANTYELINGIRPTLNDETLDDAAKVSMLLANIPAISLLPFTPQFNTYTYNINGDLHSNINSILGNGALSNTTKVGQVRAAITTAEKLVDASTGLYANTFELLNLYVYINCQLNAGATAYTKWKPTLTGSSECNPGRRYDNEYYYTKNGNFTSLNRWDQNSIKTNQSYTISATSNKLTKVDFTVGVNPVTNVAYTYDGNGNILTDPKNSIATIEYNTFHNLPVKLITAASTTYYRYDGGDVRTYKRIANGINFTDEYTIDGIVLEVTNAAPGVGRPVRFQHGEGYTEMQTASLTNITKHYVISDWLGNTRYTFKISGGAMAIDGARDYYPYGLQLPGRIYTSSNEDKRVRFTGHEHDEESNYDYHGARYYNPELGRYMSLDPLANEFKDWSEYNYTLNNPIMLIDPNGKSPTDWVRNNATGEVVWMDDVTSEETCSKLHPDYEYIGPNDDDILIYYGINHKFEKKTTDLWLIYSGSDDENMTKGKGGMPVTAVGKFVATTTTEVYASVSYNIDGFENNSKGKVFKGVILEVRHSFSILGFTGSMTHNPTLEVKYGGQVTSFSLTPIPGPTIGTTGVTTLGKNVLIPADQLSKNVQLNYISVDGSGGIWIHSSTEETTPATAIWGALIVPATYTHKWYVPLRIK